LTLHEGRLVFLDLNISVPRINTDEENEDAFNGLVSNYDKVLGEFREALRFAPDTQEGDVLRVYVYQIKSVDPSRGILGRHPAGGWLLRGSFIPRGFQSYRHGISYGSLVEVDEVRHALLTK
jgi:hypothetical protein